MSKVKKIILILISIILLSLIGLLIYNYTKVLKVNDLKQKIAKYEEHNNFYITKKVDEDGKISTVNIYFKDGKSLIEVIEEDEISRRYYDDGMLYTYIIKDKKIEFNESPVEFAPVNLDNPFLSLDTWQQKFISSFKLKFLDENINKKDCYKIESSSEMIDFDEFYVEKETGLLIKSVKDNNIVEYKYEFNNVEDRVFERPQK